ncbi:DUF6678 family protein [Bacillus sp. 165]|uniref:DUF6678 family protein n=1 Tax=Bacillus sp. 165 TaxID=1529117 RepID=UPI001ADA95DA|nr:DUF6678 family protein [Bacillus sp. 165]MBO9128529.1 hypothetical protein [Bacillus sp. 165]
MDPLKIKINSRISQKNLHPIMNNTKWEKLQKAIINDFPIPPPFQVKYVLEDNPVPESFEGDVWYLGDWKEGILPFYSVEWIRVKPRYLKHKRRLIDDEVIDFTKGFRTLLQELKIPYVEKNNDFYIYGYISNTDLISKK